MPSSIMERASDGEIHCMEGPEHCETERDKFEPEIALTDPSILKPALEPEAALRASTSPDNVEKLVPDKASHSPRQVELSSGQDALDARSGGDLLDVKEDQDRYPSGVRLLFLTFGLMAVVLMVALDNYILGLLPTTTPL